MADPAYEVVVVGQSGKLRHETYWTLEKAEFDFEKFKKGYPRAFITLKRYHGKVIKAVYWR